MKASTEKPYKCVGYNFMNGNGHLLGVVGDVHTLPKWLEIAFPQKSGEELEEFFGEDTAKEIAEYLLSTMGIRLKKE